MKAEFQKGLQTSCKHHLLFPLHPKHRWQKGSFLLHVEHHLPSKLPQWQETRDNGVMQTSLMNRRITKFLHNQQAVDLSRMSTQMTKKNIAQSDWIIPEIVQWKMWRKCRREQEQPSTLTSCISFAEQLSMLYFLHLKLNWPKTLTDFNLNKKNNNKQTNCFIILPSLTLSWLARLI